MKQTYTVMVASQNSWFEDGTPIFERDCGHKHRTLSTAEKCKDNLVAYDPKTRMWSASWHRARIYHSDGTNLTDSERY
jgi:hypothetical protein